MDFMPGFDFYWKTWRVVEDWRQSHCAAYGSLSIADSSDSVVEEEKEAVENFEMQDDFIEHKEERKRLSDHFKECSDSSSTGSDELELEFVINEEMVAFFEQSMRHKIELKKHRESLSSNEDSGTHKNFQKERTHKKDRSLKNKKKKKKKSKQQKEHTTSSNSISSSFITLPPNINANAKRRTEEMKLLYGDAAAKISGMETAFQLSFNNLRDHKKPVYWPCIPFRP